MAKSCWHGALRSAHKSCTHGHVFWKRGGMKRELAAARTSSRQFPHVLWLKVHSHLLLRACLLSSKGKLPHQACQVWPGLPSVVCHPRGMQFPGTMYICSQGLFSSAWAHCISCPLLEISNIDTSASSWGRFSVGKYWFCLLLHFVRAKDETKFWGHSQSSPKFLESIFFCKNFVVFPLLLAVEELIMEYR